MRQFTLAQVLVVAIGTIHQTHAFSPSFQCHQSTRSNRLMHLSMSDDRVRGIDDPYPSDYDAGIGEAIYLSGTGRYKSLVDRKCKYAIKYIKEVTKGFYRHICK